MSKERDATNEPLIDLVTVAEALEQTADRLERENVSSAQGIRRDWLRELGKIIRQHVSVPSEIEPKSHKASAHPDYPVSAVCALSGCQDLKNAVPQVASNPLAGPAVAAPVSATRTITTDESPPWTRTYDALPEVGQDVWLILECGSELTHASRQADGDWFWRGLTFNADTAEYWRPMT